MPEHLALAHLVERARSHDPDAWEAIYRHVYPKLATYARRRLADPSRSDDAIHEAFARAMSSIDRFTLGSAGIDGWLFGITRNVIYETYRTADRERPLNSSDEGPSTAHAVDLDNRILQNEETAALRDAFDQLDSSERELLELRVVYGLDADTVAELTDRTPGAVRTAQSRAMSRLRTFMKEVSR
ncbi:RNA polymerase sigma factor [Ilumatobacter sp.]|uniref:RNA polymerase sigma factor n=1 Tax=Ilumatobacter sp. TaxID=1967498 RepID=UPI003C4D6E3E